MQKKYIGLIIGIVVLVVLAFLVYEYVNIPAAVTVYNIGNNSYSGDDVSFKIPANWHVSVPDNILIDKDDSIDSPQFEIQISSNPWGMSDRETMNSLQNISLPEGVTQISNSTTTFDNETAYERTFIINDSSSYSEIMKEQDIIFVKNGKVYFLDFTAPLKDFDKEKLNFDFILNSIKIQ